MQEMNGVFRIVGRSSVDIIKSGGYKISALEIEEVLRLYPGISECAVVGIADIDWGERVAASLVLMPAQQELLNTEATQMAWLAELKVVCKTQLAPYKVPSYWQITTSLPRNVLGKVTKPVLKEGNYWQV